MSSKTEKPTLQGQRIKTRKRDEKEKYDPNAFRDIILQGLNEIIAPHSGTTPSKDLQTEAALVVTTNNSIEPKQLTTTDEEDSKDLESTGSADNEQADADSGKDSNESTNGQQLTDDPKSTESNGEIESTTTDQEDVELIINELSIDQVHFEALSKFLDVSGSKLNYRRYGEVLLDILIAGGVLAPGGSIVKNSDPSKPSKTDLCLFSISENNLTDIKNFAQVIHKLIRRYLYLEKILDDEIKKLLLFLKGFSPEIRKKLASFVAILISIGQIPATVLVSAVQESTVKDGIALQFLVDVLKTWLAEKDANSVWSTLKKSGVDNRIMTFLPANKQSFEYIEGVFTKEGLGSLLELQRAGQSSIVKKRLQSEIQILISDKASIKEIISLVKDSMTKNNLVEHEVVVILWNTIMAANEWSKKEDLISDQAIKYLRQYVSLFSLFTTTSKASLLLMNRIQEYCYENMAFLKVFSKIILLFYKADVLDEDTIFKWYREAHSSKGKSVFLEQMKKFIEWLENAEEESEEE